MKVGASQIAAVARRQRRVARKLLQLARTSLGSRHRRGRRGTRRAALAAGARRFFTDNKLPRRGIRLGHRDEPRRVRTLEVEGIDDERQLGNAVRFRAHEAVSIPIEQAVLDYHVIGERSTSRAQSRRVVLAAAYREPIDHYIEACRLAKLQLVGIDLEAFALLRAVAPATRERSRPAALVAFSLGHDRSTLAISDGTICDFTRVSNGAEGGSKPAIGRELGLTGEEAADLKHQVSLEADAVGADDPRCRERVPQFSVRCRRWRVNSSPHSSFTRRSPDRSPSPRFWSRAGPAKCQVSSRSSSG